MMYKSLDLDDLLPGLTFLLCSSLFILFIVLLSSKDTKDRESAGVSESKMDLQYAGGWGDVQVIASNDTVEITEYDENDMLKATYSFDYENLRLNSQAINIIRNYNAQRKEILFVMHEDALSAYYEMRWIAYESGVREFNSLILDGKCGHIIVYPNGDGQLEYNDCLADPF